MTELELLKEIRDAQKRQDQLRVVTLAATGVAFLFTLVRLGDLLIQIKRRKKET